MESVILICMNPGSDGSISGRFNQEMPLSTISGSMESISNNSGVPSKDGANLSKSYSMIGIAKEKHANSTI
jgi:hypothetical protein